jgi:hypothetical protein
VHLVGFIIRKFVMMHGHLNVKLARKGLLRGSSQPKKFLDTCFACFCESFTFHIELLYVLVQYYFVCLFNAGVYKSRAPGRQEN